ncbi:hypothetical protein ACWEKM_24035 [Streptomyces sp. NPDC004752]
MSLLPTLLGQRTAAAAAAGAAIRPGDLSRLRGDVNGAWTS